MNEKGNKQKIVYNLKLGTRIILSSVFLFSSILKSINIHSFVLETRMYIDAFMASWLNSWAKYSAIAVCVAEMLVALLAVRKEYCRIVALFFFLILSFFVYLTGLNLFFPSIMGSIESCGCFGELIHFTPMASFFKSVVLWIMSLVLVVISFRQYESWNVEELLGDKYLYLCTVASMILPLYSHWLFDELEHTTYISGFVVLCAIILIVIILSVRHISKLKINTINEKCC